MSGADAALQGVRGSLLLLRHGETDWTRSRRFIGRRPVPLNAAGRAESAAVVPILRALAPAQIVTSPLVRAHETATIIATALACPLTIDADLVEVDFGAWEGRSYDELLQDPAYLEYSRSADGGGPPGGESVQAAQARGLAAVARAFSAAPGSRICIVTHGDLIRLLLAALLNLGRAEFRRLRVDPCGLSAAELTGDWAELTFANLLATPARSY